MNILALTKYGPRAASTRQRFQQFEPALNAAGFTVDYAPLLDDLHMNRLVEGQRTPLFQIVKSYAHRLRILATARRYEAVWVAYELFPFLPLERLAAAIGRPLVVDYDDAIFHRYDASPRSIVRRLLGRKLEPLLRATSACVCGNAYLQRHIARFCPNTLVIPTVVDTDAYVPRVADSAGPSVIGWIGSPSTWANVRPLLPMLRTLVIEQGIIVRAVGGGAAAASDAFPGLELVEWSEATEIADVQSFDIGIMPLRDLPFERGKCGYKLIQYMACALPVVASPVGVNSQIVSDGDNGMLATSDEEWRAALTALIADPALRRRLGAKSRDDIVANYSLASQAPRLVELFRSVTKAKR